MRNEILKGHLDMMLLAALRGKPLHGYAIIEALRSGSEGVFDLPEGTIYPALHRLEANGLLLSDWAETNGRKRRVYSLTSNGKKALKDQKQTWSSFARAVTNVLGASHA
jgi:transcriptional regulator